MPQLNTQVWHLFGVVDLGGAPVLGLTGANFVKTLRRQSGATLITTSEVVSIAEVGQGEYWATYTPTVDPTLYVLDIAAVSGSHVVNPASWQDEVEPAAALPSEVWHVFSVAGLPTGAPVSGLTAGAFHISLRRRSGATLVATPEVVSFQAVGGGEYWLYYLPTEDSTLYVLGVSAVSDAHAINPGQWQDDVQLESTLPTGPYLTTRTRFKVAKDLKGGEHDTRIDQLLPQVTQLIQKRCRQKFIQSEITEYPEVLSPNRARMFPVRNPPIASVVSLHLSTTIPRVYDATTLLAQGVDYFVSEDGEWIDLVTPRRFCGNTNKVLKLVHVNGYPTVPGDIERAAQEIMIVKLLKGSQKQYHFLNESVGDGVLQGLRWDDITPDVLKTLDEYRPPAMP